MAVTAAKVGQDLLDVPFGEMVQSMAKGIAQAQFELDLMSCRIAQLMTGQEFTVDQPTADGGVEEKTVTPRRYRFLGDDYSLLELGFTPSFYQFVDTIIEVKMSISMTMETEERHSRTTVTASAAGGFFVFGGGMTSKVTTVSASYASKYQYHAEGSSLMRTKLVPVPPPALLEERIRTYLATRMPTTGANR